MTILFQLVVKKKISLYVIYFSLVVLKFVGQLHVDLSTHFFRTHRRYTYHFFKKGQKGSEWQFGRVKIKPQRATPHQVFTTHTTNTNKYIYPLGVLDMLAQMICFLPNLPASINIHCSFQFQHDYPYIRHWPIQFIRQISTSICLATTIY